MDLIDLTSTYIWMPEIDIYKQPTHRIYNPQLEYLAPYFEEQDRVHDSANNSSSLHYLFLFDSNI